MTDICTHLFVFGRSVSLDIVMCYILFHLVLTLIILTFTLIPPLLSHHYYQTTIFHLLTLNFSLCHIFAHMISYALKKWKHFQCLTIQSLNSKYLILYGRKKIFNRIQKQISVLEKKN